jgi:hypothetical protein
MPNATSLNFRNGDDIFISELSPTPSQGSITIYDMLRFVSNMSIVCAAAPFITIIGAVATLATRGLKGRHGV